LVLAEWLTVSCRLRLRACLFVDISLLQALYHRYPDESELLIYFIEGLMSENQTDEALEYLSQGLYLVDCDFEHVYLLI
jgi:hypothetical protein